MYKENILRSCFIQFNSLNIKLLSGNVEKLCLMKSKNI